jgi:predicted NACHT family NTPase
VPRAVSRPGLRQVPVCRPQHNRTRRRQSVPRLDGGPLDHHRKRIAVALKDILAQNWQYADDSCFDRIESELNEDCAEAFVELVERSAVACAGGAC